MSPLTGRLVPDKNSSSGYRVELVPSDAGQNAALAAAHRAGKLEGLREAASICDPMAYDSGGNIRKQIAARIAEIENAG
ncbi:MAG: hypothetical protein P4M11_01990 [Candidatus Pacebacteria bacterium]|nr:hypothetical protein [Candidatus Paceibacterota bacterium]